MTSCTFKKKQIELCEKYSAEYFTTPDYLKIGISLSALQGVMPLNGLRHPMEGNTSGWFIWGGLEFSNTDDFFKPLHIIHLEKECPSIIKFLGLKPGYRFLINSSGYEDVWFDEALLNL